jgi:protein-L-isoaspartate(D-aspartate) O-methyltransferase
VTDAARSFYADLVTAKSGVRDPAIVEAFARVRRTDFLGPGPWKVFTASGYVDTPSADEAFAYHDAAVAIAPERRINNGEPSLHARCLASVAPRPRDRVVHVGAGTGYYTAILAALAGEKGRVDAYEIEPDLAARAAEALADLPNVAVHARSGVEGPLPRADVIYVNAGASAPQDAWLDALDIGGRLIFPLTSEQGMGVMLLVTRRSQDGYAAQIVSAAAFIPCVGARDESQSGALLAALGGGGHTGVRSLRRGSEPDETSWLASRKWWLSSAEPD